MSSFNRLEIRKRNLVSKIELKRMNLILLRNCCLYAVAAWAFYVLLGFIVLGFDTLWNMHGLLYAANALVFTTCATTIAYLISRVVFSSGAINGIMNVVALGSSFLCGAFVPAAYLPDSVLAFAHILPSYYYIDANNQIMEIQNYDFETIWPIVLNMIIVLGFSIVFVVIANIISKKKQRVA
jgi:ABC-2 type transport system permease protein